ncbi:unnamed protein product [Adineta steineri]|uniref:UNC93-like protein n=2 Tax=Adineta steineri TaxID=433720 RepID=A0A819PHT2_9BILA|nr:unnamed protein product [Adineta steineri]CAF4013201.1 unnamed protein product [Adineta steineri]
MNPTFELEPYENAMVTNDNVITSNEFVKDKNKRGSGFRTYKNLFVISIAFLLQFTAFNGIQNLQSSLNTEANVGVNSSSIIYVCLILSSIFLPHPLMSIFGLKWTLVMSQIPYVLFVAANYYPKAYLMYPTAALVGLAAAPLWTSKGSYLTDSGSKYALKYNFDKNTILNRFFGIFFAFFQSCQIWGNMISYLVLKPEVQLLSTFSNQTKDNTHLLHKTYDKCGADFIEHEYESSEVVKKIDRRTIDILCMIYVCIGICSIITMITFLDQRRTTSREKMSVMVRNSLKLLVSSIKHMRHLNQILLIPITIWAGLELTFIFAQFTQAFISCTISAKYIGLIMIAFGICDSIGSYVFGQLVKTIGRWPCFAIATLISYALIIVMLVWRPSADRMFVFFIIAGLWGLADAVWQSQTSALYGVIFTENNEAAFSNFRLWESAGFALFYIIMPRIRTRTTLIILLVFLTLGMTGYAIVECRSRRSEEKEKEKKEKKYQS